MFLVTHQQYNVVFVSLEESFPALFKALELIDAVNRRLTRQKLLVRFKLGSHGLLSKSVVLIALIESTISYLELFCCERGAHLALLSIDVALEESVGPLLPDSLGEYRFLSFFVNSRHLCLYFVHKLRHSRYREGPRHLRESLLKVRLEATHDLIVAEIGESYRWG